MLYSAGGEPRDPLPTPCNGFCGDVRGGSAWLSHAPTNAVVFAAINLLKALNASTPNTAMTSVGGLRGLKSMVGRPRRIGEFRAGDRVHKGGVSDSYAVKQKDVAVQLNKFIRTAKISKSEAARMCNCDDSYFRRLCAGTIAKYEFIGLRPIELIFTRLDIELPQIYKRGWVPLDD